MDSDSAKPSRRSDARRNRERLIEAARTLFAREGTGVPLAAVAREAGVGTGTAYRHFPTQEALVEATYRDEIERLRQSATALLAEHAPDEALARWLHLSIDYLATERGFSEALRDAVTSGAESRAVIVAALTELLDAAQAAGTVRGDVDAIDVAAALGGIYLLAEPERAHRLLSVTIDGLRTV